MECHTEKLCSRYLYRWLDPSLGPSSAAVLPVDLTTLLWIQYLPEGKAPSLTFPEGSTLGVSFLIEHLNSVYFRERGTLTACYT